AGGIVMRSSAASGLEPAPEGTAVTTVQRIEPSSGFAAIAVKTYVPRGWSGFSIPIGTSNSGSKPLRPHSLPSLRPMETGTGPSLSGRVEVAGNPSVGIPVLGQSVIEAPRSGVLLASSAKVHAARAASSAWISATGAASRFGANSRGCEISTGDGSPWATIT